MKWVYYIIFCLFLLKGSTVWAQLDSTICKMGCSHAHTLLKTTDFVEEQSFKDYDLVYHRIYWNIDPSKRYIEGNVLFSFCALTDGLNQITFNLHDNLEIDSITNNKGPLSFTHASDLVTIILPQSLVSEEPDSFTVFYHGIPPQTRSFSQGYRNDTTPQMWTLSEPYGAMEWWPCKQSLKDKVDSLDITVDVPEGLFPASNGLIKKQSTKNGVTRVQYKHRYPITTYLVAVAVTNYTEFSETFTFDNGDSMQLINLVFPEYLETAQELATNTPKILQLFNRKFIPYPFKKEWYGHAQFGRGGGMEHQTMSFMGHLGFELVAHEMAHQWFGDYVTLNTWHDIFLNEGFATYLSGLAHENLQPENFPTFLKDLKLEILSEPDGSIYVEDTTSVSRVFSSRLTYYKGAYLLHMLRWELGDDAFFDGIQHYLRDPKIAYGFASMDAFIQHMEEAGDTSLTEFFNDWYYGEGYPEYSMDWKIENEVLSITLNQDQSDASVDFFECSVPLRIVSQTDTMDIRLRHSYDGQQFSLPYKKKLRGILFDPDLWLCVHHNIPSRIMDAPIAIYQAYPVPADDVLTINFEVLPAAPIKIYDLSGKTVYQNKNADITQEIHTQTWPNGVYIIQPQNSVAAARKLIVQHR